MFRIRPYFYSLALAMLLALTSATAVQAQCAMCAATVESNAKEQGKGVGEGLNSGILYLMVVPYILFGTIGFIWYRSARKRKGQLLPKQYR